MSHVGNWRQGATGAASVAPGGVGPLYSPADNRGNFAQLFPEDSSVVDAAGAFDLEELEHDVSERKPGGPVAESVLALPPPVLMKRWVMPFVGFLLANFFQSIGVFSATLTYVERMSLSQSKFNHSNALLDSFVLPDAYIGNTHTKSMPSTVPTQAPQEASSGSSSSASSLGSPQGSSSASSSSPFESSSGSSSSFGSSSASSDFGWLLPEPQQVVTAILAIAWFLMVVQKRNLRLWTQTMLVGILLSVLKGLLLLMTVMPDPHGWSECRDTLDSRLLNHNVDQATSIFEFFMGMLDVVLIWIAAPRNLVCSDGILSRPTYAASLFALGLYDAGRTQSRKLKPHFRWLYRLLFASGISFVIVWSGMSDLARRHQYAVDVALALVFTMLIYGSPVVALGVDRWLTFASANLSVSVGGEKDSYDEGDLIVPICCLPCCCVHGRYFLYSASAREAEAEIKNSEEQERRRTNYFRKMAASKAEEFRVTQEDAARRLLELEALIDAEQQRSEAREHDDDQEAKKRLHVAVAEAREQSELRKARILEELEATVLERRQAVAQLQEQEAVADRRLAELETNLSEDLKILEIKAEVALKTAANEQEELARLEKTLERYREDAKELGIPDS